MVKYEFSVRVVSWTLFLSVASAWAWPSVPVKTSSPTLPAVGAPAAAECILTSPTVTPSSLPFPEIGSWPRDYSPEGLQKLWDLVGTVVPPPFTTTVAPYSAVPLPSPPPAIFPSYYVTPPADILNGTLFPKNFTYGFATAAYQSEGAVKTEGRGPCVWDWATRQEDFIIDNTTGDVVDLHYFLYKQDIQRIKAFGGNAYSFSISWSRVFPFGAANSPINPMGLQHYIDVAEYCISLGIEPIVTLFHWDTPLALHTYYGGFANESIVDDYIAYAETIFKALNGRVKTWITFNEPAVHCPDQSSYPFEYIQPPSINASYAKYYCGRNLLLAHAGAVKLFREANITGEISFKANGAVNVPWTNSTEDVNARERDVAFGLGLFVEPVFGSGNWPQIALDTLPPNILPRFTTAEQSLIKGTGDFFAIDAYTAQYVTAPPNGIDNCVSNMSDPNWPSCAIDLEYDINGWAVGYPADPGSPWLTVTPNTLRYYLNEIHRRWPSNKMIISEFGYSDAIEGQRTRLSQITADSLRTDYYMTYLAEILLAIHEDNLPIQGTIIWSLLDNFEWAEGHGTRFGVHNVNYTSLERSPKRSIFAIADFFAAHLQ